MRTGTHRTECVIYIRVSDPKQVKAGISLQQQERYLEEHAARLGYQVAQRFVEPGKSAKNTKRPELQRLLKFCARNKRSVEAVLMYKVDRLARNLSDHLAIKAALAKHGIKLISATEVLEDSPTGRMMESFLAAQAQFENEMKGERTRHNMQEALRSGRWICRPPIGYIRSRSEGKANIKPDPKRASYVREAFKLVAEANMPAEAVRQLLNERGFRSQNNKPVSTSQFFKMLDRQLYAGIIETDTFRVKGTFEALITKELFYAAQKSRKAKRKDKKIWRDQDIDFPLRGHLFCSGCKARMTANWSKGRRIRYPYYRCNKCPKTNLARRSVENAFTQLLERFVLNDDEVNPVRKMLEEGWKSRMAGATSNEARIKDEIESLENRSRKVAKKNIDGVIGDSLAKDMIVEIESDICALKEELSKSNTPAVNLSELLEYALSFLQELPEAWNRISTPKKRAVQALLFPDGLFWEDGVIRPRGTAFSVLEEAKNWAIAAQSSPLAPVKPEIWNPLVEKLVATAKVAQAIEDDHTEKEPRKRKAS